MTSKRNLKKEKVVESIILNWIIMSLKQISFKDMIVAAVALAAFLFALGGKDVKADINIETIAKTVGAHVVLIEKLNEDYIALDKEEAIINVKLDTVIKDISETKSNVNDIHKFLLEQ
jgi:hypothetical protein